ncbi:MAG: DUF6259 domain-containing protein, partial [Armatimonadota bacterium]
MHSFVLAALLASGVAGVDTVSHPPGGAKAATAGNSTVTLSFISENNRVKLASLLYRPTETEFAAQPAADLWLIEMRAPGKNPVTLKADGFPSTAVCRTLGRRGIQIIITWPAIDLPNEPGAVSAAAYIFVPRRSPDVEWRIRVENRSKSYGLWSVQFPRIRFAAPPTSKAVVPWGWGREFQNPARTCGYRGSYPSHNAVLQMAALDLGSCGFYLACHDPLAQHKEIILRADDGALLFAVTHYPKPLCQTGEGYSQSYPVVTSAYSGDWTSAALKYRSWVESAPWMRSEDTARRRTTPNWLKQTALWCCTFGSPEEVVPKVLSFAKYFGVPTAFHWYGWHQIPFDDHYPEYFPAKPGFKEAVKQLQEAGVRVMPYINGRIVDARTDTWRRENLALFTAKDENGKEYIEVYGSKIPLTVMCPATPHWQNKVADIVAELVGEYGVDAVYIDQVASAPAKPCLDPAHPHQPGGGDVWAQGYRAMLNTVRRRISALNRSAALTTEDAAEPWSDLFDAFLMCNSTTGGLVPLYPLVYSGRTLYFGRYFFLDDYKTPGAFATKAAQMFVWGAQLGWLDPWVIDHPKEAAYLRELARARTAANRFMAFGQMLPHLRVASEAPSVRTKWSLGETTYEIEMPAVIGSL